MSHLRDILRDADPLRHEPDRLAEARSAMRRVVVAAATDGGSSPTPGSRGRVMLALAAALVVVGVVLGGAQLWIQGGATLQAAVRFELRLAEVSAAAGLREAIVADTGRAVYLHPDVIVTNADISESRVVGDDAARFGVAVQFTPAAAQRLRGATAAHIGRPIAILIDGNVVAAPIVRSALGETATLSGDYTRAQAERIADGIRLR